LDGTGVGAVTLTSPGTSVASLLTAPTAITFGEIAASSRSTRRGPALPFAKTIVTPAATACSAAWIIGVGPRERVLVARAPRAGDDLGAVLTASSIAFTSSTV